MNESVFHLIVTHPTTSEACSLQYPISIQFYAYGICLIILIDVSWSTNGSRASSFGFNQISVFNKI